MTSCVVRCLISIIFPVRFAPSAPPRLVDIASSSGYTVPVLGTVYPGGGLTDTRPPSAEQAMKVVGRDILSRFAQQHADVRTPVNAWLAEALDARWSTPA